MHAIRDHRPAIQTDTGVHIAVTGQTALNIDVSKTLSDALLPYLALVVGLAFLLLMLVFRSMLVPLKATVGFLLSVAATFGAVVAVFQWGWLGGVFGVDETRPIMSLLPILLVGILFGLAMDYQVFLVTRMREDYVHGAHRPERRHHRIPARRPGRHRGRHHHDQRVRRVHPLRPVLHPADRLRAGLRRAGGRLRRPDDPRSGRHVAARPVRVVAARWLARILPNVDVEGEKLTRTLEADARARAASTEPERVTVGGYSG